MVLFVEAYFTQKCQILEAISFCRMDEKYYSYSRWLPSTTVVVVTHILQNIFFCVQQKRKFHTGLEQLQSE